MDNYTCNKFRALNYGVSSFDLYRNFFKYHSVSITYLLLPKRLATLRTYFSHMFTHLMYLIINDVIENKIIFKFPAPKRSYIEMVSCSGDEFISARSKGAFSDVDFLASNFTGFNIAFRTSTRYGKWVKRIYVTSKYKQRITELTNLGKSLLGCLEVLLSYYIDRIKNKYPFFTKKDVETILHYGLMVYAQANLQHCDTILYRKADPATISIVNGLLFWDNLKHFNHWVSKWRMKSRFLYSLMGKKWDGYYYIGLTEELHRLLLKQRGKIKKLLNVYLTKVKDELRHLKWIKYIWRVPWPANSGWKFFRPLLKTDKLEFVKENDYEMYHQCFLGKFTNGTNS